MTDTFALSDLPGAGADRPVEERGTLDVRGKAVEHIACQAALGVPGVVRHSPSLSALGAKTLPSASAAFRGSIAIVTLDVAATWPCRAEELATTVRDTVRAETTRLSGTDVTRVDVTMHVVTASTDTATTRRVR